MIDVSIVLLNWNSSAVVLDAAASALAQKGTSVELLIVDNGSKDGSLEELKRRFPDARFLEMGFNSGFTGGMNVGTDEAHGEFVLWQNADLILSEDYCTRAVAAMRAESALGAVGGSVYLLIDGSRTSVVDACGYTLSATHRTVLLPTTREMDVVGVSGSCPVFRRKALEDLRATAGYVLDPWYFTYGEDVDVMLRLNLAGWRVRFVPDMHAWHVRSASTKPRSRFYEKPDATQVHHLKNRLATIIKTLPMSLIWRRIATLVATELLIPGYLLLRRPRSLVNWAAAWCLIWKERGRLLRDRAAIQGATAGSSVARLSALLRK
ncbi:MAG: glycosyltransferase family 2 protein [Deltaproteobacteria bacterium]|nr:glycosyltransferase family 2 protein [Deltaproteobacteria bacterium]